MSSDGLLAAVALGLAGGAFIVYLERRSAAAAQPTGSVCDALRGVDMTAYYACLASGGIVDVLGAINPFTGDQLDADHSKSAFDAYTAKDDKNKQLNGAVDTPIGNAMRFMGWKSTAPESAGGGPDSQLPDVVYPLEGSVLKFKNGCVPFQGAPGWTKCAPGTQDMLGGNGTITYDNYDDDVPKFRFTVDRSKVATGIVKGPGLYADFEDSGGVMAGDHSVYNWDKDFGWGDSWEAKVQQTTGDPSTGVIKPRFQHAGHQPAGFELVVPVGGTGGYKAGKPWTCPYGYAADFAVAMYPPGSWNGPSQPASGNAGVRCVSPTGAQPGSFNPNSNNFGGGGGPFGL